MANGKAHVSENGYCIKISNHNGTPTDLYPPKEAMELPIKKGRKKRKLKKKRVEHKSHARKE